MSINASEMWDITPGKNIGPIKKGASIEDIKSIFGEENITKTLIYIGEGEELPGLKLFEKDPEKTIELLLNEDSSVASARINLPTTKWTVLEKITVSTSLSSLESINQKPFKLYGFEWDYSGYITDWNGGVLSKYKQHMQITLDPSYFNESAMNVMGDAEFFSNNKDMVSMKPEIYEIWINL
jgi:hypothetical protein